MTDQKANQFEAVSSAGPGATSTATLCSAAIRWDNLPKEIREEIKQAGVVDDMAARKQPLCIFVPPGQVETSTFPADMLDALTDAYDLKRFVYDVPMKGWKIRIYGDRVKSSL